ncbi:MAG: rod shape-determining protein RodA, partial [Actinobacteria bacterium]|nr:rod shape-determining protein RodA [Actinomycetota bacterium]
MYFVEKSRGLNFLKQFDYMLFIVVIVLSVIGIFVLHSATRVMPNGIDGNKIVSRQLIGLIAGIILSIIISTIDYKDFKTLGIV